MDYAISKIEKGELLIHDLGYFSQDGIMKIKDKEAFFLSRYHLKTALYSQTKNVGPKAKGAKFFKMFSTFTNLCFLFFDLLER